MTSRPFVKINYSGAIELLQQQKRDKDNWATNNKEPDYPPLTLDPSTATRVFDKIKTLLGRVWGVTGMPLVYVIRVVLVPEDENEDPPFGDEESKYTSIDMEMIAHAPILSNDADIYGEDSGNLKAHGLFVPTFPTDAKKVWAILLACFGLLSAWQHVKKFANQQNGRQAWRTLHDHFFGGDKVNTMVADILLTLKVLHYGGDRRNFTFDKYCTAHVDQHNCHAALAKWNVPPLEESMKIHYFEDGITDPSFAAVKSMILVDRTRFQDFESVRMRVYVNFKRSQKAEAPAQQVHNVSALQGCGGDRQGHGGRGRGGRGEPGGHLNGGIPQEELDKVTTVEAHYYSPDEYAKFTPTKKQKYFQLMRASKAGRSPAKTSNSSATVAELTTAVSAVSAAASAISELTAATTKRAAAECGETTDSDAIGGPKWGCNCNSPTVAGHQEHVPKKPKT